MNKEFLKSLFCIIMFFAFLGVLVFSITTAAICTFTAELLWKRIFAFVSFSLIFGGCCYFGGVVRMFGDEDD